MLDRLMHFWLPLLLLILCQLILLPQTSAKMIGLAVDLLYGR